MIAKAKTYRRAKGFAPEVRLAPGPRAEAEVGDGRYAALYGYAWALVLERAPARPRLFQAEVPGEGPWKLDDPRGPGVAVWVEKPLLPLPHPPAEIGHIALAWDQAARPVIAYERAGEVWVRQWDPAVQAFVMRGPFPGVDPILTVDAAMAGVEDSDALLFHLSPDRKQIIMRLQRERYNTPYVVHDGTTELLLDQAMHTSWRVQLLGSYAATPDSTLAWSSGIYPYRFRPGVRMSAALAGGHVHTNPVIQARATTPYISLVPSVVAGELINFGLQNQSLPPLVLSLAPSIRSGKIFSALSQNLSMGSFLAPSLARGRMIQAILYSTPPPGLSLAPSIVGGRMV